MADLLLFIPQQGGKLTRGAREVLGLGVLVARATGGKLGAVALGSGAGEAAAEAISCGASRVLTVTDPILDRYQLDLYMSALTAASQEYGAEIMMLPFDNVGKDLIGRLAVRLGASAVTEVTGFESDGGGLAWTRPLFGGKAIGTYTATRTRAVIGVRPSSQEPAVPDSSRTGEVTALRHAVSEEGIVARLVETIREAVTGVRLEDAGVIVSGGRGLGGPEPFRKLQELAELLGGAMGASRAACDAGWVPSDHQVGQTGAIVAPDLYIAVGISGASQHLAGINGAKTVIAINKDPEAPIFRRANLGIVADYKTVIPALTAELMKMATK